MLPNQSLRDITTSDASNIFSWLFSCSFWGLLHLDLYFFGRSAAISLDFITIGAILIFYLLVSMQFELRFSFPLVSMCLAIIMWIIVSLYVDLCIY